MTRATTDRTREDGGPDVQKALTLLALVPHAPNESVESVGELLDRGWAFRAGDAMVLLAPQPDRAGGHVEIIWWLPLATWLGEGMDALIAACEAVLVEYGERRARAWNIGGLFGAQGDTPDELLAASESIARIHTRSWLPSMRITRAPDTNYMRGDENLGVLLDAAKAWLVRRG